MHSLDISIDCETWGLIPGSVIRSIGLVAFDPFGNDFVSGRDFSFEMNVNVREPSPGNPVAVPAAFGQSAPPPQQAPAKYYRRDTSIIEGPNGYDFYKQASTVEWWNKPENDNAAKMLTENQEPVEMALGRLMQVFDMLKPRRIWARGPQADIVWLEYYFKAYGYNVPWGYDDVRDVRTHMDTANLELLGVAEGLAEAGRTFVKHFALDDARFQAYCVQAGFWTLEDMRRVYAEVIRNNEQKKV